MTRRESVGSVTRGLGSGSSSAVPDRLGRRADRFSGRGRARGLAGRDGRGAAGSRTRAVAHAVAVAGADGFTVGSFIFKPGGRVKLDVIRDFDPAGNEDSFDPRTFPLDGSEGTNSSIHARETRLSLDMRGPVEGQELRMYVETDFYGSGNALRLRHAYGKYGGLMAGQTWSTFVDEDNMPNTIDFESPMAFPSLRQAQARWTFKVGENASWSLAVEDNKSSIQTPAGIPGKAEYPMPDLASRFRIRRRAPPPVRRGLPRQGPLPPDGGPDGRRDALGRQPVGEGEDVRPRLHLRASSPSATASAATAEA